MGSLNFLTPIRKSFLDFEAQLQCLSLHAFLLSTPIFLAGLFKNKLSNRAKKYFRSHQGYCTAACCKMS